jgi:hypothetical protein
MLPFLREAHCQQQSPCGHWFCNDCATGLKGSENNVFSNT